MKPGPPFEIKIKDIGEIRMGSPYNACEIELVGLHKFNFAGRLWQDKYAWTEDFVKLLLIKWDMKDNEPGFKLCLIDVRTNEMIESPKLFGLVNTISLHGNNVSINKFLYNKEQTEPGRLCCHMDETYTF